ncbi:succinyl-diaminopimelate desuccinylase [Tessaracoccus flavus]|uniref:Succinyl-diaminopimelate desuccinylase n=1 Tax=Tessaracoccus flavus TaxID=1610493 RepID=A0A1Q2CG80_9ACTN|nr:succinyl-diaminopimelate desuccinylase [Tessaracoccus flavus]AQP45114.1 succinyl-diaminopimelate desuccinylase [Tessaracoccus flavus]SDY56033.1 succinyldiaminopimelate desuccinylase [Tessaracoccus flavus]
MSDLIALMQQIMDVESVSGNERALADLVEARLGRLPHLTLHRDGDCVVARTTLGRAERVVIAGHLDTVPVAGNLPSRIVEHEDGPRVWGRGACDMKGGVTVMLALAEELAEPNRDITWIFYDHEEVAATLNGLGRLSRNRPDLIEGAFAVLMEPTSAQIEGGCQGTIRIELTTLGVAAHSARAWMGHNAIHDLAPVLETLAGYESEEIEVEGLVFREGLNAVGITGGMASNVIPPSATVQINYRFAPDKTVDDAVARLRDWFPHQDFEVTDASEAARPGLHLPLAQEFVAAIGEPARPKYGWTDVSRFSALGIPAVNYGPGDSSVAHSDDEFCPASDLDKCAAGLRRWLTHQGEAS